MSVSLDLVRKALHRPDTTGSARAFLREVDDAAKLQVPRANMTGPGKGSSEEIALSLLEAKNGLDSKSREEMLAYIRAIEEMRIARRRLTIQVLVSVCILALCIIVLVHELRATEVRKEWLAMASGFVGTVVGYWLR